MLSKRVFLAMSLLHMLFFLHHNVHQNWIITKGSVKLINTRSILSRSASAAALSPRVRRRELYKDIRSHIWGSLGKRQIHGWSTPLANTQVIEMHTGTHRYIFRNRHKTPLAVTWILMLHFCYLTGFSWIKPIKKNYVSFHPSIPQTYCREFNIPRCVYISTILTTSCWITVIIVGIPWTCPRA